MKPLIKRYGKRKNQSPHLSRKRRRLVEQLEQRQLLASDLTDIALSQPIQDQLLSVLSGLDRAADSVGEMAILNQKLPGADLSLNDLVDSGTGSATIDRDWGDVFRFESVVTEYFARFDPSSDSFDSANVGQQPMASGLATAILSGIDFSSTIGLTGRDSAAPLTIDAGVDSATNQLQFNIALAADFSKSVNASFDSLGSDWTSLGIDFSADANVTLNGSFDMGLSFGVGLSDPSGVDPFFRFDPANPLTLAASIDGAGSSLGFELGPIGGTLTANAFSVGASATVNIPTGAQAFADRIAVTPGAASLDLDFEFDASLYGTALGTPGDLPSFAVTDSNLFDSTAPDFTIDLAPLALNFSAEHVVDSLIDLASKLATSTDSEALGTPIPLLNKTVGELLTSPAEPRRFAGTEVSSMTAPTDDGTWKTFTVNLGAVDFKPSLHGIRRGGGMTFLSTTGDRFGATVSKVDGNQVTLRYPSSRTDVPDASAKSLEFSVPGNLGEQIKAAIGNYIGEDGMRDLSAGVPSLGELLANLGALMGFGDDDITYDESTMTLMLTPSFTPEPLQFETKLDFGDQIAGLGFEASGNFLIAAAPTIRLPLGIVLDPSSSIAAKDRVFVVDDTQPEVSVALAANLDDPRARASIGFLSAILEEDASVTDNDGIAIAATLGIDIDQPASSSDGRVTITELLASPSEIFDPSIAGSLTIDGLQIKPEVAGATIPGSIDIFTLDSSSAINPKPKGAAAFANLSEMGSVFSNVSIGNSIGDFSKLSAEDVVSMFIDLGSSVQTIAGSMDVPAGIPFVEDAISEVVNFADTGKEFARKLYHNAKLIGGADIAVTDGRLSADASFTVRIEDGAPIHITVAAADTTTNTSIDDLYADINAAIAAAGADESFIAAREQPHDAASITGVASATDLPTTPDGYERFTFTFAAGTDLFTMGIKPGDVIEYVDTSGQWQQASIDHIGLTTLSIQIPTAQPDPAADASRGINLYDAANLNRLTLRTVDTQSGLTLSVSTIGVTAASELPASLSEDVTLAIDIDGVSNNVVIPESIAAASQSPTQLVGIINAQLAATDFDANNKLDAKLLAVLVGGTLRLAAVDSSIGSIKVSGGEALGFTKDQTADTNTASTELGLGSYDDNDDPSKLTGGQLAVSAFRVGTIQDLVHALNGLIQQQFAGAPFDASLNYHPASGTPGAADYSPRSVSFNIALGTQFTRSIELDFDAGLDVGFADLSVVGGAEASFIANAGIELTVGLDLERPGSDRAVDASVKLSELDDGRGTPLKVGVTGTPVADGNIGTEANLNLSINRFDASSLEAMSVTVSAIEIGDNTSLGDLATDLNDQIRLHFATPLTDPLPIEVGVDDDHLVIVSNDATINGLSIATGTTDALGFAAGKASDLPDLFVKLRDGDSFNVNLDGADTLADVKREIEDASVPPMGGAARLTVTFEGGAIKITDTSIYDGTTNFMIQSYSDDRGPSGAGITLGIVGEVTPVEDNPDTTEDETDIGDVFNGLPLFEGDRKDQFYINTAGSKVFAGVSVDSADIDLIASLGLLDLGIVDGTAAMTIDATVGLTDVDNPDTPTDESTDNKLRLRDFSTAGFKDILTPSFAYGGTVNLPIDGSALAFLPPQFKPGYVPGAGDPDAAPMSIDVALSGSGNEKPTLTYGVTNLESAISSFKNFSMKDLARVVQQLADLLRSSDLEGLNDPIPVINKTPNDVLDVVDSLARAAEDILAGPDVDALLLKIGELESLIGELAGTPEQNEQIRDLVAQVKAAANPDHTFALAFDHDNNPATDAITTAEISQTSTPAEIKGAIDLAFSQASLTSVVSKVTGSPGGPYEITFAVSANDTPDVDLSSTSGLVGQTQEFVKGDGAKAEVQEISFVTTGKLVAAITALQNAIGTIPASVGGQPAVAAKVTQIADSVASRSNLGAILGNAIKGQLGIPDEAFYLTVDFVDADADAPGFQAAARVLIDFEKTATKNFAIDFDLPDLGPVTVNSGANVDFTVAGLANLDFAFRFDTFTPYLLNTSGFAFGGGIDSSVNVMAGIAGIEGGLTGNFKLQGSVRESIPSGQTNFQLAAAPVDNLVIVSTRPLLSVGSDYTVDNSGATPEITFTPPPTGRPTIEYTAAANESVPAGRTKLQLANRPIAAITVQRCGNADRRNRLHDRYFNGHAHDPFHNRNHRHRKRSVSSGGLANCQRISEQSYTFGIAGRRNVRGVGTGNRSETRRRLHRRHRNVTRDARLYGNIDLWSRSGRVCIEHCPRLGDVHRWHQSCGCRLPMAIRSAAS
ncbi:MAG: hypothetical protein R3C05_14590 [Pirellulaceae bacterium]